jgi:glycosyltransferase involved in cell wall biosynthesis
MPSAISIMDLSYIYYPELFTQKDLYQLTHWTEYSVRKATLIFTISEYSKKTIIEHYKVDPQKVVVTYPGYDRTNFQFSIPNFQSKLQQVRSKYNIHDKYILFLGTIQPRKNIEKLIEAFELLKDGNLQLILVGKKGWLYEPIFKRIERSPKKNKIVYIDFATKEESPILYKGAQCFVLPSLYEGFGIPVIEAMASGTPVVVSNVTSLPEIVGDAALKVDPYNAKELANALTQILTQEMVRKMCIQKGLKQALKFSWDDCASKTLKTLVQMGHKKV